MVYKAWWSISYIIISVVERSFSKPHSSILIYAQIVSLGYLCFDINKQGQYDKVILYCDLITQKFR